MTAHNDAAATTGHEVVELDGLRDRLVPASRTRPRSSEMSETTDDGMPDITYCGASRCWECGRMVSHKPRGGPMKRHGCALRWLSRARWRSYRDGWHEGYRFAVENRDDPAVLADADDYGTGWAGHMRVGHLTVGIGDLP